MKFGGLKIAPKPATSDQTKKKMIRAKINNKGAQSVNQVERRMAPVPKVAFTIPSSKIPEKKDKDPLKQQKCNTIVPAATILNSNLNKSPVSATVAIRSCPELQDVPEEISETEPNILSEMTEDEISAFRDIFDMFDSNGGGTIGAGDLDQALQSVDINLTQEEVTEIFDSMDIDGSGEIEFDEFLRLVANTEKFLQSIMSRGKDAESVPKENVLFDAIALFMKNSALASVNEIVRYYHTNAQRYSNPHDIIGHYTAGARLIGLTQRQMRRDIQKLTKITSDSKSPYAQPLVTSLDTFFEEKSQSKKLRGKQRSKIRQLETFQKNVAQDRATRGKIRLQFLKCVKPTKPKARRDSLYLQFLSMQKHIDKHKHQGRRKVPMKDGRRVRMSSTGVDLPQITTRNKNSSKGSRIKDKLAQDLTFDDLELIRNQVGNITTHFYRRMQRAKLSDADKHWQELGTEEIKSETLRSSLKKSFLAYSDYSHIPVSSIVSSYCKTNLICPAS